jgi:hypothetical protein
MLNNQKYKILKDKTSINNKIRPILKDSIVGNSIIGPSFDSYYCITKHVGLDVNGDDDNYSHDNNDSNDNDDIHTNNEMVRNLIRNFYL